MFEYGDHEPFDYPVPSCDMEFILTTEKDLARGGEGINVWAVRVDLEVGSGGELLDRCVLGLIN